MIFVTVGASLLTQVIVSEVATKIALQYGSTSSGWPYMSGFLTGFLVNIVLLFIFIFKLANWLKSLGLFKIAKLFGFVSITRFLFIWISFFIVLSTFGGMFYPNSVNSFAKGRTGVQIAHGAVALIFLAILYDLVRAIIRDFKNEVGTNFQGADLKYVNFNEAKLENCKFENAGTRHVNWSRVEGSRSDIDFTHPRSQLLISRDGQNGKYLDMDLSNQDLADVKLQNSNLSGADLTRSNLQHTNLSHANLSNVKAGSTDFRHVTLTGACIQNWAINAETRFDDVICEYIYFAPDQDAQSRRPLVGRFELGDFEKLIRPIMGTVN